MQREGNKKSKSVNLSRTWNAFRKVTWLNKTQVELTLSEYRNCVLENLEKFVLFRKDLN